MEFLLWLGPTLRSVVITFPSPSHGEIWWFHHSFLWAGEGPHYCRLLNQLLWFSQLPEGELRKERMPSAVVVVLGMWVSLLAQEGLFWCFIPLWSCLLHWFFWGNSVPSSWAEDTEFLQMAQSCHYSSVSLAFPASTVGRKGSNSQHCFLCQLWLVVIKST